MQDKISPKAQTSSHKVFFSYNFPDEPFVRRVHYYLSRQPHIDIFLFDQNTHGDAFDKKISTALNETTHLVYFRGSGVGDYQAKETFHWISLPDTHLDKHRLIVDLPNPAPWPSAISNFHVGVNPFRILSEDGHAAPTERQAAECAADLARSINGKWIPYDGLPLSYIFHYEKDIIGEFASSNGRPSASVLHKGCPDTWPRLTPREGEKRQTPLNPKHHDIGSFRSPDETVLVDIRSKYHRRHNTACSPENGICCLAEGGLTFLEAGPRKFLLYGHQRRLNVGILVSGGIAPGINAVIAGLVDRHSLYWKEQFKRSPKSGTMPSLRIRGYLDGFSGLLEGRSQILEFQRDQDDSPQYNQTLASVLANANRGGSMFGTSRYDEMSNRDRLEDRNHALNRVLNRLWLDEIDILYVIGGDGSMKAAHALHVLNSEQCSSPRSNVNARPFSIVGIPKTMDNDILWVWQSFGFMSAVEKASECLRLLNTEATSNPRLCIIQLFGSDSGFTVSHAALASLQCDAALIPEMRFNMDDLFQHIKNRLQPRLRHGQEQRSPFGVIVMAETAVPDDWFRYVRWNEHLQRTKKSPDELLARIADTELRDAIRRELRKPSASAFTLDLGRDEVEAIIEFVANERRVYGQTPDALRTVSLRMVSQVLQQRIKHDMGSDPYWKTFRVFTSEPRHLLRSSPPSANDIITGRRFGTLAVDNAMAGYSDFMISQWLTEYVLVPLSLVVLGRKRVPRTGIFWKSVLAKTDQPDMTPRTSSLAQ